MKLHLSNSAFGVLDYATYPVGMLIVTPIVLQRLGATGYGIWIVATAVTSTGGIIAAGFGDANIQQVARQRAAGDPTALRDTVRCLIGLNLALGSVLMLAAWLLAPLISRHVAGSNSGLLAACQAVMRLASVLILLRALESVCVSTQRAFERYGAAIGFSLGARLLTLMAAGALALLHFGIEQILWATLALAAAATALQLLQLKRLLPGMPLVPRLQREASRSLLSFGIFSWLQAVAGVVFGQSDRLLLGVSLGASAVTSYSLCVQLAQPLFGFSAAALHFFFPYLAGQLKTISQSDLRRTVKKVFCVNLALTVLGMLLLLTLGPRFLTIWAGGGIAEASSRIFPPIVLGTGLLGLCVTGTYVLLAFGRVHALTWISIGGGCLMLWMMWWLLPVSGVGGLALARLAYGFVSLLIYIPVFKAIAERGHAFPKKEPSLREVSRL